MGATLRFYCLFGEEYGYRIAKIIYIYIYITTRSRDPAHQELLISDTAKRGSRIILDAQDNKGHGLIPTRNIYIIYHDQSILNHAILFRN